jgi:hypothetical protein
MAIKTKATGTAIANWDDELAREAELAAKEEKSGGGTFLSTRGGQLSYRGNPIAGNRLNVVILDYVFENVFYNERFDPDSPRSPVCFAFARKESELVPNNENCEEVQSEQCEGCPQNEWGSADTGKGKMCKNTRRLALITADSLDEIEDAEVAMLSIPVTSIKGWGGYVQQLAISVKRPTYGVVTEISVVPDSKTQYKVGFKLVGNVDASSIAALREKREGLEAMLTVPYRKNSELPEPAVKKKTATKSNVNKRSKF